MTTPSAANFLYVVTALECQEGGASPKILGVYSSQEKAAQQARSFFEQNSQTFRNSAFDKTDMCDLVSQEDASSETNDLSTDWPAERFFLELFSSYDIEEGVAVAINAVVANKKYDENRIPLLLEGVEYSKRKGASKKKATAEENSTEVISSGTKVHVLVSASGRDAWGYYSDPNLMGVFLTKEDAMQAAKSRAAQCREEEDDEDDEDGDSSDSVDNTDSIGDFGAVVSFVGDTRLESGNEFGIAMDSLFVDKEVTKSLKGSRRVERDENFDGTDDDNDEGNKASSGAELDFRFNGDTLYFNPSFSYSEISRASPVASATKSKLSGSKRPPAAVSVEKEEKRLKLDGGTTEMLKPCRKCQKDKPRKYYSKTQWGKSIRTCNPCLGRN